MINRQRAVMTAQQAPASWPHDAAVGANQTASMNAQRAKRGTRRASTPKHAIEKDARLRVARPTKFVEPDETIFRQNTEKFSQATGVQVRVDFVGFEDLRPQTAVTANTGAGPDVVVGWMDDPHLYSDKLIDVTELADLAAADNLVAAHHVVGVVVADRDAVVAVVPDLVVFGEAVLHAPAPEQADSVALQPAAGDQRAL